MWKVYYRRKLDEHRTDQLTMTTRSTNNFLSENSSKYGKYIPRQTQDDQKPGKNNELLKNSGHFMTTWRKDES